MKTKIDIFHPPIPQAASESPLIWANLPGASLSFALSNAITKAIGPLVIIAKDPLFVSHLIDELHFFNDKTDHQLIHFPDWETLPYDFFSPHQDIISTRLSALHRIPMMKKGAVLTTISTLMHRLPPQDYLDRYTFVLKKGDHLNIDILRTRLVKVGYQAASQVREHGEFAIRGSIIDLFPMGNKEPFRIDLLDNEVDSIRIFSKETQRSAKTIDQIRLLPAKEFPLTEDAIEYFREQFRHHFVGDPLKCPVYQDISEGIASPGIEYYLPLFFENTATLFDYLPKNSTIILVKEIEKKADEYWHDIEARYEQRRHDTSRPLLPPTDLFISPQTITKTIKNYLCIEINDHHQIKQFAVQSLPVLEINHQATETLLLLQEFIQSFNGRILFCVETLGRREVLLQLLKNINLTPLFFHSWNEFLTSDALFGIVIAPLDEGFQLETPKIAVAPETHLYGNRIMQRRLRKKTKQDTDALIRDLTELQINDAVVHIEHGVGRYLGLEILKVGDQINEFLCLEYQGGDKLYVPVASLHLISRYTGVDQSNIPFNKLGTDHWQKAKRKAIEKVKDVAAELLDLYAKRAARPGYAFQLPEIEYAAFSSGFPFEETPDQLQAIERVFADMMSDKPMDRVICGDVGFGKTEVALRAAFLSVVNNKQVALLVPTTLLAQQHYQYFQDRFADWPIQIAVLSRFKTAKEQKEILKKIVDGKVDIVIGTHKLLQTDCQFKSLGLLIIDEEHRFGVKQKERLKTIRPHVDLLTLTATPIPRTLNMALSGIRDLSLIATPPARRLSVKTFLYEYQKPVIQEAIQREIMRGGQVYFLHNDITTINKKAEEIKTLVHEARVAVAHGQMNERELERIMSEFYHRHYNILVCSTIIESGIDVPTANTIIINRADTFGLAQLHQLRGRVGRSHHQAYAYMLIPSHQAITPDAKKRLEAITSLDALGIGFTLATHDLEIRGAGELLGEDQSGNIQEIGFTLYMDLLSRAVDALKAGEEPHFEKALLTHPSEIDLHIPALIPDDYLNDVQLRLQFYKRISNADTQSSLDDIQVEMIDRFGLLPHPLKNLFAISELKLKLDSLGILKLDANVQGGKIEFKEQPKVNPQKIIQLIQTQPKSFRLDGPTRLRFTLPVHDMSDRIRLVEQVIDQLGSV